MDLIYTNKERIDQGVLTAYAFDLSFGAEENDFELTLGKVNFIQKAGGGGAEDRILSICGAVVCGEAYCGYTTDTTTQIDTTTEITTETTTLLDFGAFIYIEDTEYGGIVDSMETSTDSETIIYRGRTWHGILDGKIIQPDTGENYYTVSGDANSILSALITRIGLDSLFTVSEGASGINISNYQFARYCGAYDGIRAMLAAAGAKLKVTWEDRSVLLSAEPIVDYTDAPIDGDIAVLTVTQCKQKVNHLICLGTGELAEREVIHLYVDSSGSIVDTPYYTGIDEITETYDFSNAESSDELRKGGIDKLKELMNIDKAEISIPETLDLIYDIGDMVGASDIKTGVSVSAAVSQKIVKIKNGAISTEYKTGG